MDSYASDSSLVEGTPPRRSICRRLFDGESVLNDDREVYGEQGEIRWLEEQAKIRWREENNLMLACFEPSPLNTARKAQSCKLLHLPTELQIEILQHADRSNFQALSQTCVALRAAIMPFILEYVILSTKSPRLHTVVQALEDTLSRSKDKARIIRHIQLPDDATLSKILSRLLPLTPNLKSLTYGYKPYWNLTRNDYICAREFSTLLKPVRHTLATLKLTYGQVVEDLAAADYPFVDGWLRFQDMPALRTLETTITWLLGPSPKKAPKLKDVLPRGLQELRIIADPWDYDPVGWDPRSRGAVVEEYLSEGLWVEFTPGLRLLYCDFDTRVRYEDGLQWHDECDAVERIAGLVRGQGLLWD